MTPKSSQRIPPANRIAKAASVYFLLGLFATWAIAWLSAGLVVMSPGPVWAYERAGPPHRVIALGGCLGGASFELKASVSAETLDGVTTLPNRTNLTLVTEYTAPGVASALASYGPVGLTSRVIEVVARGWPWPAATCELLVTHADFDRIAGAGSAEFWGVAALPSGARPWTTKATYETVGALVIRGSLPAANAKVGAILLPYIPYWPGFAGDTVALGGVFALLHYLSRGAVRWWRRERGRCAACGYDLGGLDSSEPCPECGRSGDPCVKPRSHLHVRRLSR